MNTFRIHYASQGTLVNIEKVLNAGVDHLDILMTTVGDALSAAGFDDDHRLTMMKDYWAELNQPEFDGGCMSDFDKDEEDQLELPFGAGQDTYAEEKFTKVDFKRGDIVKVVASEVMDDHQVLGQVGVVTEVRDWMHEQNIRVKFAEGDHRNWWVAPIDLDLVWRG